MPHQSILSQRDLADLGLGSVKAATVKLAEVAVLLGVFAFSAVAAIGDLPKLLGGVSRR